MEELGKVIKTAIKMETDGIKFYQGAADKTSHPFGKEMFLSFKKDEERHLRVLQEILNDLGFSNFEKYFGETPRNRIKTVFKEVRNEIRESVAASPDEMEALQVGMKMEEKSVYFYQDALSKATSSATKELLERLILEEKDHYQILENTHSFLQDSGDWFLWEEKGLLDGG